MPVPPAVVLVQVAPAEAPAGHGDRLIAACTQALRKGACVLASGAPAEQPSSVIAEVAWEDDQYRVVAVRVGRPGAEQREWITGKLVFDEHDALSDRWTTTGFTIATLVGDLAPVELAPPSSETPAAPAAPVQEDRPPTPPPPGSKPAPALQPRRFQLSAGALVGQAMEGQTARTGPWASLAHRPLSLPLAWRVRGAVSFVEDDDVSVRWSTMTAGLELDVPLGQTGFSALAGLDGGASHVSASGASSDGSRWAVVVAVTAGLELRLSGPLVAHAGGELSFSPATQLALADSRTISDRRAKLAGLLGLGWEL